MSMALLENGAQTTGKEPWAPLTLRAFVRLWAVSRSAGRQGVDPHVSRADDYRAWRLLPSRFRPAGTRHSFGVQASREKGTRDADPICWCTQTMLRRRARNIIILKLFSATNFR